MDQWVGDDVSGSSGHNYGWLLYSAVVCVHDKAPPSLLVHGRLT
jgi:hypothetical protein